MGRATSPGRDAPACPHNRFAAAAHSIAHARASKMAKVELMLPRDARLPAGCLADAEGDGAALSGCAGIGLCDNTGCSSRARDGGERSSPFLEATKTIRTAQRC